MIEFMERAELLTGLTSLLISGILLELDELFQRPTLQYPHPYQFQSKYLVMSTMQYNDLCRHNILLDFFRWWRLL